MWWGQLCVDNGLWCVTLCMLAFPLLLTGLISFRCCRAAGLWEGLLGAQDLPQIPSLGASHVSSELCLILGP